MAIERIIITFHQDGTLNAASAKDYNGEPLPVTKEQLQQFGLTGAAEIQTLTEAHTAELATAAAALATERTAKEAAQASLQEHQRISDALVTAAAAAIAANDTPTLHQILTEASLFGKAREKAKLEAEHAAALAAAADLQAKLAAL